MMLNPKGGAVQEALSVIGMILGIICFGAFLLHKLTTQPTVSHQVVQSILEEMQALLGKDANKITNAIWSQTKILVRRIFVLQLQCKTRISGSDTTMGDCMHLQALDDILVGIKREGILRCAQNPREAQAIINEYRNSIDELERAYRAPKKHLYA